MISTVHLVTIHILHSYKIKELEKHIFICDENSQDLLFQQLSHMHSRVICIDHAVHYIPKTYFITGSLSLLTTIIQFLSPCFNNVYLIFEYPVITLKRRQPFQLKSYSCFKLRSKYSALSFEVEMMPEVRSESLKGWRELLAKMVFSSKGSNPLTLWFQLL